MESLSKAEVRIKKCALVYLGLDFRHIVDVSNITTTPLFKGQDIFVSFITKIVIVLKRNGVHIG